MISGGDILTTGAARTGYWALTFRTYPAEIKGGPCMYQVRVGAESVHSQGDTVDLLVCFNQEAFDLHHQELADDGHIVCDAESVRATPPYESRSSEVPLGASPRRRAATGAARTWCRSGLVCGLLGLDTARIEEMILKRYAHKGDVGESNIRSLRAGFEHARDHLPEGAHRLGAPTRTDDSACCSGNQAICLGALHAGLRYYAGYPITPGLRHPRMAGRRAAALRRRRDPDRGRDRRAGVVLGASFAGKKAMTATSGPGLSLMTELVGLAGIAEIPAVIVDAQRSGPSTGMPTKTEQSDLNHALYAGHGEAPRVVMAPTTVADCFHVTVEAFNTAKVPGARHRALRPVALASLETIARPHPPPATSSKRDAAARRREQRLLPAVPDPRRRRIPDGHSRLPRRVVSTGIEHDEAGHPPTSRSCTRR